MLNLSILDYPDHADPVKRLTEHLVNKVVSAKSCSLPLWQFSKRSNAAVSNTASMCLDACPRLIEQFLETRQSRDDEALNINIIIDRSN